MAMDLKEIESLIKETLTDATVEIQDLAGDGDHYSHIYYYNTSDSSNTDVTQKGNADHNAQIVLRGNQPTTLTLLQQGSTNQSYSLTQYCVTTGGCNISVTQGN